MNEGILKVLIIIKDKSAKEEKYKPIYLLVSWVYNQFWWDGNNEVF